MITAWWATISTRWPSSACASVASTLRILSATSAQLSPPRRRPRAAGQPGEVPAERPRLGASGVGELDVGVAHVELEPPGSRGVRLCVGDVAEALAVAHQPQHRRARPASVHALLLGGRPPPVAVAGPAATVNGSCDD